MSAVSAATAPLPTGPRGGRVTADAVRRALYELGRSGTVRAVRDRLGGGSLRDIARMVKTVRDAAPELEDGLWVPGTPAGEQIAQALARFHLALRESEDRQQQRLDRALALPVVASAGVASARVDDDALARMGERVASSVKVLEQQLEQRFRDRLKKLEEFDAQRRRHWGTALAQLQQQLRDLSRSAPRADTVGSSERSALANLIAELKPPLQRIESHLRRAIDGEPVPEPGTPAAPSMAALATQLEQLQTRVNQALAPRHGVDEQPVWATNWAEQVASAVREQMASDANAVREGLAQASAAPAPGATATAADLAAWDGKLTTFLQDQAKADKTRWAEVASAQNVLTARVSALLKGEHRALLEAPRERVDSSLQELRLSARELQKTLDRAQRVIQGKVNVDRDWDASLAAVVCTRVEARLDAWGEELVGDVQRVSDAVTGMDPRKPPGAPTARRRGAAR